MMRKVMWPEVKWCDEEQVTVSRDGLFEIRMRPIKSMSHTNENGDRVTVTFKKPKRRKTT